MRGDLERGGLLEGELFMESVESEDARRGA